MDNVSKSAINNNPSGFSNKFVLRSINALYDLHCCFLPNVEQCSFPDSNFVTF